MDIKNTIRVILADDHPLVRRGMRRILEKHTKICVIGEAGTGREALRLVRELRPHVLLLDMEMPDINGIQVARTLREQRVPVSIVVLSACDDAHFVEEVLHTGVDAYLGKSEAPSKIRQVVTQVYQRHAIAFASLVLVLLPKIGWTLVQAASSIGTWSIDPCWI